MTLVEQLPTTLTALETGTISWAHARMLVEVLAPMSDAEKRAEVEARLLARAGGRTVAQLRVSARRAVLRADAAAAARRLAAAIPDRQVRAFPGKDGMASLSATLSTPVALACLNALRQYAQACATPDDERSLDQRMVDCLVDLILRPGETGLPPVQAQLTVVASVNTLHGGDEPGDVDGHPIPAALVRELAYALGLLPRPTTAPDVTTPETTVPPATASEATEGGITTPQPARGAEGTVAPNSASPQALSADEAAAARIAHLLGLTTVAGTALTHLPAIAVTDELSGQLLALTTAAGIRAAATCARRACRTGRRPCTHPTDGPGLGPPAETAGYRPSVSMERFVGARDRRCRFPGCRAPAMRCDLDHNTPWPAGATSVDNLCCLCHHHHRLSYQAPGWRMRRLPGGVIEWTAPGGQRVTTRPPRFGTDEETAPPGDPVPPAGPPLTTRECVLGRPRPPGTVEDDPAPF